jgi:hypothetical protein
MSGKKSTLTKNNKMVFVKADIDTDFKPKK